MPSVPEDPRVPQQPSPVPDLLPRLFSDADPLAVQGPGGGGEGVGVAGDRDTVAGPLHGGARPGRHGAEGEYSGLLDADERGVRGAPPASRDELAALILRYRQEQSAQRSRRRREESSKPRFTAEQRLLILDSWLRSKLPAGGFARWCRRRGSTW